MSTKGRGNTNSSDASLEHIREILFGDQSRNHETEIKRVDKRISEASKALRDELKQKHSDLEHRIKDELSSIKASLREEATQRADALKALTKDMNRSTTALAKSISELDEKSSSATRELKKSTLQELKQAVADWQAKHDELSGIVDEELDELRTNTADRAEMSELFQELGMRINGELKRPAPKSQ